MRAPLLFFLFAAPALGLVTPARYPAQKDTGPTPDIEHDSRNAAPTVQLTPQREEHTHTHRARAARDHTPVPTLSASHERYFNSTPIIFRSILIPDARVARRAARQRVQRVKRSGVCGVRVL